MLIHPNDKISNILKEKVVNYGEFSKEKFNSQRETRCVDVCVTGDNDPVTAIGLCTQQIDHPPAEVLIFKIINGGNNNIVKGQDKPTHQEV